MNAQKMMIAVVVFNGLLAVVVCLLALELWRWRCAIAKITRELQVHESALTLAPKQIGYALAQQRMQVVQTRLNLTVWQQRSRQLQQLLQLARGLRALLLVRSGKTIVHRSNKRMDK